MTSRDEGDWIQCEAHVSFWAPWAEVPQEVGAAPQALLRPSSVGRVVLDGARRHCQGLGTPSICHSLRALHVLLGEDASFIAPWGSAVTGSQEGDWIHCEARVSFWDIDRRGLGSP